MNIPCGHGMFNGYTGTRPLPKRTQRLLECCILPFVMVGFVVVMSLTGFLPREGERK